MRTHKKLIIAISMLLLFAAVGTAVAYYFQYTEIDDVTITSHSDNDVVFINQEYTVTCTTSSDQDCDTSTGIVDDPVTHAWSGDGDFEAPATGTSVTWTAPGSAGSATITVTADDSPKYNDTAQTDSVTLTVADTIYVDIDATGNEDGSSWTHAFTKIQDGLDAAANGNITIEVNEGTYYETIDFNGASCVLTSTDPNDSSVVAATIIDGTGGSDDVVRLTNSEDANTVITGFTIRNADYSQDGIYTYHTSPTISKCSIINNYERGIMCVGSPGSPTISDCNVSGNGSHGMSFSGDTVTVSNCDVSNNSGNGVNSSASELTITGCTIYKNGARGISLSSTATNKIENCKIIRNGILEGVARSGIKIGNDTTMTTVTNCIVAHNFNRGITSTNSGTTDVINCTVISNVGYGIYDANKVTNCIVWGNWEDLASCSATYSCIGDGDTGTGNISARPYTSTPGFTYLGFEDYHLASGSPCIDAGDNSVVSLSTDIEGTTRKIDDPGTTDTGSGTAPIVDMGAYEYNPNASTPTYTSNTIYVDVDATGNEDGSSWADAFTKIQDGLNAAISGDIIEVNEGTYYEEIDFNSISCTLTSTDPNDSDVVAATIIDGTNGSGDVITLDHSENAYPVITGFTITNGYNDGINSYHASPTISKCVITNNGTSLDGDGISCTGGGVYTISDCNVSDNDDSGIHCSGYGHDNGTNGVDGATITDCDANNNGGDGMHVSTGDATISGCTTNGNGMRGIALASTFGDCIIEVNECTMTYNGSSNDLAGIKIMHDNTTATITDCNSSNNYGRGINATNCGTTDVIDSIVCNNGDWGIYHPNSVSGCTVTNNGSGGIQNILSCP